MTCTRCWSNTASTIQEAGPFRLVHDPGHWGASDPYILVLGISKGNTQSRAYGTEPFDGVAFKNIRHRMLDVFHAAGLLPKEGPREFERRFTAAERDFAFASVVRCSLTGMDRRKQVHTADSPNVVPAFRRGSAGSAFVENCVDEHLVALPSRTRLVLLLGNADAYIKALADVIARRRAAASWINPVAYTSGGIRFVHVAHPSRGNGFFNAFVQGQGVQGEKRNWAREALDELTGQRITE